MNLRLLILFILFLPIMITLGSFLRVVVSSKNNHKPVTSCYICHELKGKGRVRDKGLWHKDHEGEVCHLCHGGDETAKKKGNSHKGLEKPMANTDLRCGICHQFDLERVVNRYMTEFKVEETKSHPPRIDYP